MTMGPWIVEETKDENGVVVQRRIFTAWEHGQLKGPAPVVTGMVTIAKIPGHASPYHGVHIDADDAELIRSAPELKEELRLALLQVEDYRKKGVDLCEAYGTLLLACRKLDSAWKRSCTYDTQEILELRKLLEPIEKPKECTCASTGSHAVFCALAVKPKCGPHHTNGCPCNDPPTTEKRKEGS